MPDPVSPTTETPPVKVTHGSASIVGYAGGGALALLPLLLDALTGAEVPEPLKRLLVIVGGVLVAIVIIGRQAQAAIAEWRRGGPATLSGTTELLGEPVLRPYATLDPPPTPRGFAMTAATEFDPALADAQVTVTGSGSTPDVAGEDVDASVLEDDTGERDLQVDVTRDELEVA
jgi:hypothetical protein